MLRLPGWQHASNGPTVCANCRLKMKLPTFYFGTNYNHTRRPMRLLLSTLSVFHNIKKKMLIFVSGCNWCVALLLLEGALAEIRDRYSDWRENELTDVVDWEESSGSEKEIVEPAVATLATAP